MDPITLALANKYTADTAEGMGAVKGKDGKDGKDGVSPTVTTTPIDGGTQVTITDASGPHSFDVMDGKDGTDSGDVTGGMPYVDLLVAPSDQYTSHDYEVLLNKPLSYSTESGDPPKVFGTLESGKEFAAYFLYDEEPSLRYFGIFTCNGYVAGDSYLNATLKNATFIGNETEVLDSFLTFFKLDAVPELNVATRIPFNAAIGLRPHWQNVDHRGFMTVGTQLYLIDFRLNWIIHEDREFQITFKVITPVGESGVGVPAGGAAGQILSKKTAADYDTQWIDAPQGGGTALTAGDGLTIADGVASVDNPVYGIYTKNEFDSLPADKKAKGTSFVIDSADEWWSPQMTSDTTPSPYVVSASSNQPIYGSAGPYAAFDNNPDTYWGNKESDNPPWISIDLGEPTGILGLRMLGRNSVDGQLPHTFLVQGSDDNSNWDEVYSVSGLPKDTAGELRSFAFDKLVNYRYYRITNMKSHYRFTSQSTVDTYIGIADIEFLMSSASQMTIHSNGEKVNIITNTSSEKFATEESVDAKIGELTKVEGIYTQAEYDALPEDKQTKGMYVIKDAGEGGSGGSSESLDVYSTEEKRIGTWIDGRPLYRKVIEAITLAINVSGAVWSTNERINIVDLDGLVLAMDGSGYGNIYAIPSPYVPYYISTYNGGVQISQPQNTVAEACGKSCKIIIKYTKTTDQPEVTI